MISISCLKEQGLVKNNYWVVDHGWCSTHIVGNSSVEYYKCTHVTTTYKYNISAYYFARNHDWWLKIDSCMTKICISYVCGKPRNNNRHQKSCDDVLVFIGSNTHKERNYNAWNEKWWKNYRMWSHCCKYVELMLRLNMARLKQGI